MGTTEKVSVVAGTSAVTNGDGILMEAKAGELATYTDY